MHEISSFDGGSQWNALAPRVSNTLPTSFGESASDEDAPYATNILHASSNATGPVGSCRVVGARVVGSGRGWFAVWLCDGAESDDDAWSGC